MKIKNMPILFFILAFAGVALLGYGQVLAIDVTDRECSSDEIDQQLCIEAFGYVVQVYVDDFINDPTLPIDGVLPWPIVINHTKEFRYRATLHKETTDCKGVPTWNYFVQRQSDCVAPYLLSSDPPGAQLLIPGQTVPKCNWFTADMSQHLLKLNPSLNCGYDQLGNPNEVVFSFTFTDDVQTSFCNSSVVVTKSGCAGGFLQGPGCGDLPVQTSSFFESSGGTVEVALGRCGEGPLEGGVKIDDYQAIKGKAWICTPKIFGEPVGDPINNESDWDCYLSKKAGLQSQGCVIDSNPRIYLYGGDGYTR